MKLRCFLLVWCHAWFTSASRQDCGRESGRSNISLVVWRNTQWCSSGPGDEMEGDARVSTDEASAQVQGCCVWVSVMNSPANKSLCWIDWAAWKIHASGCKKIKSGLQPCESPQSGRILLPASCLRTLSETGMAWILHSILCCFSTNNQSITKLKLKFWCKTFTLFFLGVWVLEVLILILVIYISID